MKKEYKINEELASVIEDINAFEDTIASLSKRSRKAREEFWKGVYLLHPELKNPEIKLNHNTENALVVTVAGEKG